MFTIYFINACITCLEKEMPYKFKGKKDCQQSDGSKGKYLTIKKDGSQRCFKSEKQYKASQTYSREGDGEKEENLLQELEESYLRKYIQLILIGGKM